MLIYELAHELDVTTRELMDVLESEFEVKVLNPDDGVNEHLMAWLKVYYSELAWDDLAPASLDDTSIIPVYQLAHDLDVPISGLIDTLESEYGIPTFDPQEGVPEPIAEEVASYYSREGSAAEATEGEADRSGSTESTSTDEVPLYELGYELEVTTEELMETLASEFDREVEELDETLDPDVVRDLREYYDQPAPEDEEEEASEESEEASEESDAEETGAADEETSEADEEDPDAEDEEDGTPVYELAYDLEVTSEELQSTLASEFDVEVGDLDDTVPRGVVQDLTNYYEEDDGGVHGNGAAKEGGGTATATQERDEKATDTATETEADDVQTAEEAEEAETETTEEDQDAEVDTETEEEAAEAAQEEVGEAADEEAATKNGSVDSVESPEEAETSVDEAPSTNGEPDVAEEEDSSWFRSVLNEAEDAEEEAEEGEVGEAADGEDETEDAEAEVAEEEEVEEDEAEEAEAEDETEAEAAEEEAAEEEEAEEGEVEEAADGEDETEDAEAEVAEEEEVEEDEAEAEADGFPIYQVAYELDVTADGLIQTLESEFDAAPSGIEDTLDPDLIPELEEYFADGEEAAEEEEAEEGEVEEAADEEGEAEEAEAETAEEEEAEEDAGEDTEAAEDEAEAEEEEAEEDEEEEEKDGRPPEERLEGYGQLKEQLRSSSRERRAAEAKAKAEEEAAEEEEAEAEEEEPVAEEADASEAEEEPEEVEVAEETEEPEEEPEPEISVFDLAQDINESLLDLIEVLDTEFETRISDPDDMVPPDLEREIRAHYSDGTGTNEAEDGSAESEAGESGDGAAGVEENGEIEDLERFRISVLQDLESDPLEQLVTKCSIRELEEGEQLFEQGDESSEAFYLVIEGSIDIEKNLRNETETVSVMEPGDIFGEYGMSTGNPRQAGARAGDASELLEITRSALESMQAHDSEAHVTLYEAMLEDLAHRFRHFAEKAQDGDELNELFS